MKGRGIKRSIKNYIFLNEGYKTGEMEWDNIRIHFCKMGGVVRI